MKKILKKMALVLPLVFCTGVGVMHLIPKYYTSSFTIVRESQQAVEVDRTITLNQPKEYDLGIFRTDNAVSIEGYSAILKSDAFLYNLLEEQVSTLDGQWSGSLGCYLNKKKDTVISYDSINGWYSLGAIEMMKKLRKAIASHIDYESEFVTISCTAADPLVATQMARLVNASLAKTVDTYEQKKMEAILLQIKTRTQEANQAVEAAQEQDASNLETLMEIARSFARQQVVYEAQMIHYSAYTTLIEPTVDYGKAGPSRWKLPLGITIIIGLCLLGWKKRNELSNFF